MALSASVTPFKYQIKFYDGQRYPVHKYSQFSGFDNHRHFSRCSMKVSAMEHFKDPKNLISHVINFRDRLCEMFPEPVKEFPLKKAENLILQRLFVIGEKALKWSLIILFIISSLSDVMLSISRNKELIIPFGLFVGCVIADFLKEVSQEVFLIPKEGDLRRHLLGIGFFFVLVKIASAYFSLGGKVFLSHVGNGGLMQVLWLLTKLQEVHSNEKETETSSLQDTSI